MRGSPFDVLLNDHLIREGIAFEWFGKAAPCGGVTVSHFGQTENYQDVFFVQAQSAWRQHHQEKEEGMLCGPNECSQFYR